MSEPFVASWTALLDAVAGLDDGDFARPSGCAGWLVRDLVSHLIIDAQDVLITLATPADTTPTRTAVTYWSVDHTPPRGDDPLSALTVRLAAAYGDPALMRFHLDDVGAAAGRAAALADPDRWVSTQGQVLAVRDYLGAYVLEATLHHLDLITEIPGAPGPTPEGLARSRALLEQIAGAPFPASWPDTDVLLVATGRSVPTGAQRADLGELAAAVPLVLS